MLQKALSFARENILLTAVQHAVGGFGLAIVIQFYVQGQSFAPVWLGWVGVIFSAAIHLYELGLALTANKSSAYSPSV